MLASLERDGKLPISAAAASRRSRRSYWFAALGVFALIGAASFYARGPFDGASERSASTSPAPRATGPQAEAPGALRAIAAANALAAGAVAASPASVADAPSPASAPAASASSAQIELTVIAPRTVALTAAAPPAEAGSAVQAAPNPLAKLALGDTETASTSKKAHAMEAPAPAHKGAVAAAKTGSGHAGGDGSTGRKMRKSDDDADTELVAAIIARLDRRGAKPAAVAPGRITTETDAALASMVRECASSDLLNARRCRNRVCEKHWGKADACPASRAPKPLFGDRAAEAKRL